MRKPLFALIAAASLALCLMPAACQKKETRPKVALIMKSLANPFFKRMEDGARAHQKDHDADYVLLANGLRSEGDIREQISLVEQMMTPGVKAIVIAPANSDALVSVCKKALDSGIIVINIDNKLDEKALAAEKITIPFYGPDNRQGAKLAGDYLAKQLKPGDEVIIIEGIPGAFNGEQRKLGFLDAVNAAKLKLVADNQSANWERSQAEKMVPSLVLTHPNLRAILCANDSMAIGAVNAIEGENARRKADGKPQILVIGFDNLTEAQELIKSGKMLATIDQYPEKIAAAGLDAALQAIQKKGTPTGGATPVELITKESLQGK